MSAMKIYELSEDWDEQAYDALLNAAERRGGYCALAHRHWASAACLRWIDQQAHNLEAATQTMRWPGTIVLDESERATLLRYRVNTELISDLRRAARTPFEWIENLPEDLSFLRPDGRPWFVSIAHETDAYFKLMDDEVSKLREQFDGIALVLKGEALDPAERY